MEKMDAVAREILATGYSRMSFSFSDHLPEIFAGWSRFAAESPEFHSQWTFDIAGKGDPDDGLIPRKQEVNPVRGERYDDKLFFHYRPELLRLLLTRGVVLGSYIDWLNRLNRFWNICERAVQNLADALDRELPGYSFRKELDAAWHLHKIRLLYYRQPVLDTTGEEVLASTHTDRDFLTLHVGENYAGLMAESLAGTMSLVPAERNVAIAFPGKKAQLMTGGTIAGPMKRNVPLVGGILRAMPHSVVDTRNRTDHRLSLVFFSHTPTVIPGD